MRTLIITVVAIMAILGWNSARADQLEDILADKVAISSGVCHLNRQGLMAKKKEDAIQHPECVMLADPKSDEYVYFLIVKDEQPSMLLKVARIKDDQSVIWRNPDGMI